MAAEAKEHAKQQVLALYHQQGVEDLFDEYASTFDEHLVQGLRYDVPNLLLKALLSAVSGDNTDQDPPYQCKKCLDLGCGTGLAGLSFRDNCEYLEGVDLSSRMVAKARERDVYDRLDHGTLLAQMKKHRNNSFELIISADVFMYVLDLRAVFAEVKRILKGGGWFVFSTESLSEDDADVGGEVKDFVRRESERFAHTRKFVLSIAADGFEVCSTEDVLLRMDEGKEIRGDIFVLRRRQ